MSNEVKDIFKALYVVDGNGKAHKIEKIEDISTIDFCENEEKTIKTQILKEMPNLNFEVPISFVVDSEYASTDISDIKDEISAKLERIEHETYAAMYQLAACKDMKYRDEKEKYACMLNNTRVKENVKLLLELRDTIDDYVDYLSNLFFDEADAYISDPIELN